MAKQVIGIGTTANDGTGDSIRDAFDKCNDNFTELYTDDAGDVGSITATAPIERDSATGAVTISLADAGISTAKITDDAVTADKLANSINTEIAANTAKVTNATHTGDVTGATALTIGDDKVITAKILDANVTTAKIADDAVSAAKLASDAVVTASIVDDNITFAKLEPRYTAKATSTGTGSQNLDASTATTFLLTGNVATATLTIQNMKLGHVIDTQMTGTLSSAAITLATNFSSTTINKIGATDFDTSEKNLIQVVCVDDTDAAAIINYSVGKITADTTP